MGLYSAARYDVDTYGQFSKLNYSAEPFISKAVNYTQVQLTWVQPLGEDISELRVLRSNDGFPETPEDGKIIYSWDLFTTDPQRIDYLDGTEELNPVPSGTFVYYRIWVQTSLNIWRIAGDTYTLVPSKHASFAPDDTILVDTKNKLLDILPRVYTTSTQSPIDEVDPNSELAIFLDAFAFELDIALTYADLLLPSDTWQYVSPEILTLQSAQFGIELEPYVATKQQRKLVRNAILINQNKGTLQGIEAFVESYTGFAPTVFSSPNLVLSTQDSTFTNGVGFWKAVGNATISSETTIPGVPDSPTEPYIENNAYVGKVVVNQIGSKIVNGEESPVTKGTPVTPGTAYNFSGYAKSASGDMGVKGFISWYDINGNFIEVDPPRTFVQTPVIIGDSSWQKFQIPARSPGVTETIEFYSISSGVLTFYLGTINTMVKGETITVSGISSSIDGIYQIDSVGSLLDSTLNQVRVRKSLSDTALTPVRGTLTETIPNTLPTAAELAVQIPSGTLDPKWAVIAASITDGIATVTFGDENDDIAVNDMIVIQAINTILSFGLHTILTKVNFGGFTTITFQLYTPYTGVIITDDSQDGSWTPTGLPYGFGIKVLPNTGVPSPKGYYASFELEFTTTGTLYLDLLQMATFNVPEYHQPRAVEIFLNPNKTNFLLNPGFAPSTLSTTWSVTAEDFESVDRTEIETAPAQNLVGDGYALMVEGTADGETSIETTTVPVTDGNFITASFYAKTSSSTPVNLDLTITAIDATTATPIEDFSEEVITSSTEVSITNEWTRFYATLFIPSVLSESVSIKMVISGETDSEILYFDRAQVEASFKATDYFAGPDGPDLDQASAESAFWGGTPYNSASYFYANFDQKIDRLRAQLPKYLPTNLSFLILWYGGGVAKPIL